VLTSIGGKTSSQALGVVSTLFAHLTLFQMVAVKLAIHTLVAAGFRSCHIILHSDNMGVVGALHSGHSCNAQQNMILRKIVALFQTHSIWVTTLWIPTKDNTADNPSRGRFPPSTSLLPFPPALPCHLTSYLLPSVNYHQLLHKCKLAV
jgi:hypothetical protein